MQDNDYLVQQPQQARSQETMQNILDAAALILERKNFEELTIAEIVHEAGTSVGAFYGRFKDKDALLQALDERFFDEFEKDIQVFLSPQNIQHKSITEIVHQVCALLVTTYSRQTGVLRSLNLKSRLTNDSHFLRREKRSWDEFYPVLQKILLSYDAQISHPDPHLATRLGFQQMFYTMREILLWEPLRDEPAYPSKQLIDELSRAYLAYLGIKDIEQ
ncbi:MAG: TetR/AcrR family transcriptional regulator [Anaerolineaceae bacterium]|nr:TetR/AcrR family transcriptional regulator [Anaerolineaceae bacterium]